MGFFSIYTLNIYNMRKTTLEMHNSTDTIEDAEKTFIKQVLSGKTGIFRSMCFEKRENI